MNLCEYLQRHVDQTELPKHVEFYSKNKFEKLVHLVGYIIRIYYDARSTERQVHSKHNFYFISNYLATRFDPLHGAVIH